VRGDEVVDVRRACAAAIHFLARGAGPAVGDVVVAPCR
jgi:hypothetical protein